MAGKKIDNNKNNRNKFKKKMDYKNNMNSANYMNNNMNNNMNYNPYTTYTPPINHFYPVYYPNPIVINVNTPNAEIGNSGTYYPQQNYQQGYNNRRHQQGYNNRRHQQGNNNKRYRQRYNNFRRSSDYGYSDRNNRKVERKAKPLKKSKFTNMQDFINSETTFTNKKIMKDDKEYEVVGINIVPDMNMLKSNNGDFVDQLLSDIFGIKKEDKQGQNEKKEKEDEGKVAPIIKENEFDLEKEYEELPFEINNLNDLVKLGNLYDESKPHQFGINMKRLSLIKTSLENLQKIIGMESIKKTIFNKIITFLQGLGNTNDMHHIVIQAPPGYGKTMLGYYLSEIFYKLGIIKTDKKQDDKKKTYLHPITNKKIDFPFVIAKRKDLIGEYLGHTAPKVEKKVNEACGGVLFIDEAYSLGSANSKKESYSETCLNTINQLLSEKSGEFICIIAGYKDELKKSFFTNPGLERRFRLIFNIEKYKPNELGLIFEKMINDSKWKIADSILISNENSMLLDFLKKNKDEFKFCGGDMEALLQNCRDAHSKRVLGKHPKLKKIITMEDINEGYKLFMKNMDRNKNERNDLLSSMYV